MKLHCSINFPGKRKRTALVGQILAEAAIGLALMVLVWILVVFSNYMANNRIRTVMAARYVAWIQGNGGEPTDATAQGFFFGNDTKLAHTLSPVQVPLITSLPDESTWASFIPQDFDTWSNTVTFGISPGELSGTTQFPFTLMNVQVPFMPPALLPNFTIVSSHCAWPTDVGNTWNSASDLLKALGLNIP